MLKTIKHVHNQLDVFFGDGWENWVRISTKKDKEGKVDFFYIAGMPITKLMAIAISKELNKK